MRRRFLVSAAAVLLTACSLALDGFTGGDASGPDGGPDAGGDDGGAEAAPADAAIDVALEGCATKPDASFCADFDEPDAFGGWDDIDNGISLTQSRFTSAPNAAVVSIPKAGSCAFENLIKKYTGTFTAARIEAQVRATGPSSFLVISFVVDANTGYNLIATFVDATKFDLYAQKFVQPSSSTDVADQTATLTTPAFGGFVPVVLSFESTPSRVARLRVGDVEAVASLPASFPYVNPRFSVGAWCRNDTIDLTVDDVAVFLTP